MGKPHNDLLKAVLELLALRKVFAWPNNTGGAMVKGGSDRLSKAQHVFATAIRAAGGRFVECRQLEDVEEALNRDA